MRAMGRCRLDEYDALIAGVRPGTGRENGEVFTRSALGIVPAGRGGGASCGALVRPRAASGPGGALPSGSGWLPPYATSSPGSIPCSRKMARSLCSSESILFNSLASDGRLAAAS